MQQNTKLSWEQIQQYNTKARKVHMTRKRLEVQQANTVKLVHVKLEEGLKKILEEKKDDERLLSIFESRVDSVTVDTVELTKPENIVLFEKHFTKAAKAKRVGKIIPDLTGNNPAKVDEEGYVYHNPSDAIRNNHMDNNLDIAALEALGLLKVFGIHTEMTEQERIAKAKADKKNKIKMLKAKKKAKAIAKQRQPKVKVKKAKLIYHTVKQKAITRKKKIDNRELKTVRINHQVDRGLLLKARYMRKVLTKVKGELFTINKFIDTNTVLNKTTRWVQTNIAGKFQDMVTWNAQYSAVTFMIDYVHDLATELAEVEGMIDIQRNSYITKQIWV